MFDKFIQWLTRKSLREKPEIGVLCLVHQGLEKGTLILVFWAFLLACPYFIDPFVSSFHGDWVDEALSQVLTDRYGRSVSVQNVRFAGWRDIYFVELTVRSEQQHVLMRASHGSLHLAGFDLSQSSWFETELRLHGLVLFPEYYRNTRHFSPWIQILRKPVQIRQLVMKVMQNEERTFLRILHSDSEDVILEGARILRPGRAMVDGIHVNFSPWMMMRALL